MGFAIWTYRDAAIEGACAPINWAIKHQNVLDPLTRVIIIETRKVISKGANNAPGGSCKEQVVPLLILNETQRVYGAQVDDSLSCVVILLRFLPDWHLYLFHGDGAKLNRFPAQIEGEGLWLRALAVDCPSDSKGRNVLFVEP